MTMTPFTCETFAGHLADHLESDAAPAISQAMRAHGESCPACAALLADIAAIRAEATGLPVLSPSRDLWSGIAGRIDAQVVPMSSAVDRKPSAVDRRPSAVPTQRRHARGWWPHPAIAAAALVGITAGVTHYLTRESIVGSVPSIAQVAPEVRAAGAAAAPPSQHPAMNYASAGGPAQSTADGRRPTVNVVPVNGRRPTADAVPISYRQGDIAALDSLYYREIIRLRRLLAARRTELDPGTVAVIDRNMLVIDRAIQECRAALAGDPASTFLNQQLNEALESKIELLRTAAMMPVGS